MSWFGLDPQSIADRVNAGSKPVCVPTATQSLVRGTVGFTVVSLAGFAPWAFGGGRLARQISEGGMYALCAIVFLGLSAPVLHRLIIGPDSLRRFYRLFSMAFLAYAVIWCAVWFGFRFRHNDYLGLVLGTVAFGWIVANAFDARSAALRVIAVLVAFHALGYPFGSWLYTNYQSHSLLDFVGVMLDTPTRSTTAKLLWGLGYGLGFGAGIGYAFYACQTEVRKRLSASASGGTKP